MIINSFTRFSAAWRRFLFEVFFTLKIFKVIQLISFLEIKKSYRKLYARKLRNTN